MEEIINEIENRNKEQLMTISNNTKGALMDSDGQCVANKLLQAPLMLLPQNSLLAEVIT